MQQQDIFESNPMSVQLDTARKQAALLAMHITGVGMKQFIQTMDEFETEQKKEIRQKYTRTNVDIFKRVHKPIDKVFSANGGSLNINIPESKQKGFNLYLQNIRKSMNLRKWVQNIALKAYQIDPNGLIFMETDADGIPYPTYKSTIDIFYYEAVGREIKQVIFNVSVAQAKQFGLMANNNSVIQLRLDKAKETKNNTRFYRVVDAVTDKIVEWDGKELIEIPELNLPNPFPKCPGMIVSDIYEFNSDLLLSPDSNIVDLANDILTQNSVFSNWKKLHMFPKHWRIRSVCPTCMGNGTIAGETCKDCNGTTYQKRASVRDEIIVPMPDGVEGKVSFPERWSGYDSPTIEPWQLQVNDVDRLEDMMFETMWGCPRKSTPKVKADPANKTATQVLDESSSRVDGLYAYSEWAESVEKFVIDMAGPVLCGSSYKGCSVCYGDRYVMESPDEIWNKYSEARIKGASQAVLDSLLTDYLESKFFGNPMALQVALKQMYVEPWVHLTIAQVELITAASEDKTCKIYFSEWVSLIPDMDWILKTDVELRDELKLWCAEKTQAITTEQEKEDKKQKQAA